MSTLKHRSFSYRWIAVFVFFFLNCFIVAGTLLNASPASTETFMAGFPAQNHQTEQEDNIQFSSKIEQRQGDPNISRNKKKYVRLINRNAKTINTLCNYRLNDFWVIDASTFILKPRYYLFLSLYHLF